MMERHCRFVTAGGPRCTAEHVKAALAAYEETEIDTVFADGSPCADTSALFRGRGLTRISYIPLPGLNFSQRIEAVGEILNRYSSVTLAALDDLITDQSIIQTYNEARQLTAHKKPIIYGFGPDITYTYCNGYQRNLITVLPRYLLSCDRVVSQQKYWESLAEVLREESANKRLLSLITEIGFFPFVYAVYSPAGLLALAKAHIHSVSAAGIDPNGTKAGLLYEYLSVAAGLMCGPINVSQIPFRMANYYPQSEGSRSNYNHRSISSSLADTVETKAYFHCACDHLSSESAIIIRFEDLLSGWITMGRISRNLPGIQCQIDPQGSMFLRPYIKHSLYHWMSSGLSPHSLDMIRGLLSHWPNV